jgi:protein-tyrosine phosphatase
LVLASIELVAPARDAVMKLVPDCQRTVITNETMSAREAVLRADRHGDKKLRHSDGWRRPSPVVFKWRATDGEGGPWELVVSKNPDLSNARVFLFRGAKADKATGRVEEKGAGGDVSREERTLNLEIATRYYWRVASNITCGRFSHGRKCSCKEKRASVLSEIGTFTTEDLAPRWIAIDGNVGNFRDLGGRIGCDGRRVRQGMVYRSQGLNNNSVDGILKGKNRLTVSDVEYLTGTLGIRTDLDLRTACETAGMNGVSPLGASVAFIHHSSPSYKGVFDDSGKSVMAKNFRVFCDERNYPILFHCIGGADRTGALGYVLNGVLGVSRQELETDWESTFYPNIPGAREKEDGDHVWNSEWHFNEGFGKYGGKDATWNERIELYLLDCGITREEIEKFRSIMLEPKCTIL